MLSRLPDKKPDAIALW